MLDHTWSIVFKHGANCPYYKKDIINCLEKVQIMATKLMSNITHLPYNLRLQKLDLFTLEHRRVRGDLIETYKMCIVLNFSPQHQWE